jgi:hypothetical protein
MLKAWVPALGIDHANGADVDAREGVEKGVIVGRW